MELILWRHAEAEDANGKADSDRELTKKGRRQSERMALWLRPKLATDWKVLVSPARRTLQTVAPLGLDYTTSEMVGLGASQRSILEAARWPDGDDNVLVVGHQPTLGEVIAHLLKGEDGDVSVRKGAIWWFATRRRRDGGRDEDNKETILKAVLNPDLLDD